MRTVQVILVGFGFLGIASLISGIQTFTANGSDTQIFRYTSIQDQILSLIIVIICLLGAYEIHKRSIYVWWGAWIVIAQAIIAFVWEAIPTTLSLPVYEKWIATSGVLLGVMLVGGYWALWWKKQRAFFTNK